MTDATVQSSWGELMAAAQAGDGKAYQRLLREILPFIRVIIRASHATPDRVEDVVQDVLLTIHRIRHTYDPARPFEPWLAAIARRRSIDAVRRRVRVQAHETSSPIDYETFADPSANRELEAHDASEELRQALATLPPKQREALELLKVKELSLVEASKASGQSVGALKVSVHRAIKALQARMKGS